jgi:apolipoprotein N-acyltransferase
MPSQGIPPVHEGATLVSLPQPQPQPVPGAPTTAAGRARPLLLALTTAGLLYLSYFPVGLSWLAWFALVPLLVLVRMPARPWRIYLSAYVGGLAFFWPVLQWLRVADPRMYATWAALATYSALYVPIALFLVRALDRRAGLPLPVTLPIVWTAVEFFRSSFIGLFASLLQGSHRHDWPGGFSWYLLGYTQHDVLEVIQVADLAGVYAVTFLICVINALLFEVLFARAWFRAWFVGGAARADQVGGRLGLLGQGLAVLALFLATLVYGSYRLHQDTQVPGPRVALLQGNLEQRIRIQASDGSDRDGSKEAQNTMLKHYYDLADEAARHRPDLVVWPETSYPGHWVEMSPGVPTRGSEMLAVYVAHRWRTDVLLGISGCVYDEDGWPHGYNSAVLINRSGNCVGRYGKIHRVPFGEYVPLRHSVPWLNRFAPYDFDYSVQPGEEFTRFPMVDREGNQFTFGVVICYEDTVPEMARPYGGGDGRAPADFVVNISNDGWFDGTAEHDEHLAICRFRAVETRRSVARAVNMGISAVIDSNGRVLQPGKNKGSEDVPVWDVPAESQAPLPVSEWAGFKQVQGVLLATIPIDNRPSLYARWGNWLPWSCWGLIAVGLVVPFFSRRPRTVRSA